MSAHAPQLESGPAHQNEGTPACSKTARPKTAFQISAFHHSAIKHFRAYLQRALHSSGRNRYEEMLGKGQAQW